MLQRRHVLAGAAVLLLGTPARAATIQGKVTTYPAGAAAHVATGVAVFPPLPGEPLTGAPVTIVVRQPFLKQVNKPGEWYTTCLHSSPVTHVVTTDAQGNYALGGVTPTTIVADIDTCTTHLTITTPGPEATVVSTEVGPGDPTTFDLTGAPHVLSAPFWARRHGNGSRPIYFIEGFDPEDRRTTGVDSTLHPLPEGATDSTAVMFLLLGSTVPAAAGGDIPLLIYLLQHDYTLWHVTASKQSGQSIKGQVGFDGSAFQAMMAVQQIHTRHHPHRPIVIGGHSQGGLVSKVGLFHWCKGDWNTLSGGVLATGCPEVAFWYAVDAPLEGAQIPVSLQRYVKDPEILTAGNPSWKLNQPAAMEMLRRWVGWDPNSIQGPPRTGLMPCKTHCNGSGVCDSGWMYFLDGCVVDNHVRDDFVSWAGGPTGAFPARPGGVKLPVLGMALGEDPILSKSSECPQNPGSAVQTFLRVSVGGSIVGDHYIKVNSAGGGTDIDGNPVANSDECETGSRGNFFKDITGGQVPTFFGGIPYNPEVYFEPTFIGSRSALATTGPSAHPDFTDIWYNNQPWDHVGVFPVAANRTFLAWLSEFAVGTRIAPVCTTEKFVGKKAGCRAPTPECVGNEIDDDGDDRVDMYVDAKGEPLTGIYAPLACDPTHGNYHATWVSGFFPGPITQQPPGSMTMVSSPARPGRQAHQSVLMPGMHQHFFDNISQPYRVKAGDNLFADIYLGATNRPREVMLQWNDGTWEHRAFWGEDLIGFGTAGTASRRFMGALPQGTGWVRLEVPAAWVGLEGAKVKGMAFTLFDGTATWDVAGRSTRSEEIWVDDLPPAGFAIQNGQDYWQFAHVHGTPTGSISGYKAHYSPNLPGIHQHYFEPIGPGGGDCIGGCPLGPVTTIPPPEPSGPSFPIAAGDVLFTWIFVPPGHAPTEIMLQWHDGTGWEHRAYWGANQISWGTNNTASRLYMGPLPPAGQWVPLRVPAAAVGMVGKKVFGMAFTLYGGEALWDRAGKSRKSHL